MATRMQQRRGTAAQWSSADPILAAGEIGFETDTGKFKIGDGTSVWSSLSYFTDSQDFDTTNFVLTSVVGQPNGVAGLNANGHVPINQLGALIDNAPDALNTLNELATAISALEGYVDSQNATQTTELQSYTNSAIEVSENTTNNTISTAVSGAITDHNAVTTDVHGISDTSTLATQTYVNGQIGDHASLTTSIHGIADTSLLATEGYVDAEITDLATTTTGQVNTHAGLTTSVHGIADTSLLATTSSVASDISAHNDLTLNVHGIANTANLATQTYADDAVGVHNSDTTNVHGISDTANIVLTDDARLSDERTPLDASVTDAKINGTLSQSSITNLTTDLAAKATLESPALTGTPTAPTATAGDNSTQVATTEYVETAVSNLVASAPGTLDTLNELAAALGDDANFSTTVTNSLALKLEQSDLDNATYYAFNAQTASYTIALSDSTNMVTINSESATTVTVPANSSVAFPVGTYIDVFQLGSGQVTIAEGSGVTIYATPGKKLRTQYSGASLVKRDTDTWYLTGDIVA